MPFPDEEHASTLVARALGSAVGQTCLTGARQRLLRDLRRNRFRSARAVRVYTSSIDDAVWAYVGESPLRYIIYRNHLDSQERAQRGRQLTDAFAHETGAVDHGWLPPWLPVGRRRIRERALLAR